MMGLITRRVIMERLKQTYSPEILTVMKMSNIEGLKQHYRCHKDKRAKTIKTMASVTDPARLLRLQTCLDKRMEFLDERGVEDGGAVEDEDEAAYKTEEVEYEDYFRTWKDLTRKQKRLQRRCKKCHNKKDGRKKTKEEKIANCLKKRKCPASNNPPTYNQQPIVTFDFW